MWGKTNLKSISNKLAKMAINWHKIGQMPLRHKNIKLGITWSFFVQFRHYCSLNACFLKTNRMVTITKLYNPYFRFLFLPHFFAPRPHMGSIARMDLKLPLKCQDVSWPSPLTPNLKSFFQSERPEPLPPPLSLYIQGGPGNTTHPYLLKLLQVA